MEKILEIASRVNDPVATIAFLGSFLGVSLFAAVKYRKGRIAWLLGAGLILLPISALVGQIIVAREGIYHIRVTVLGIDHQPVKDKDHVDVTDSAGGEIKSTEGGWEIAIPPQTTSKNSIVSIFVQNRDAFLAGSSTIALGANYYPLVVIQLESLPAVRIHGEVIDGNRTGIGGADVILPQCSQSTKSDEHGLFSISSCVALGQMVTIRAEKGGISSSITVPASDWVEVVLSNR